MSGSVCNMDRSICFIDERTYETRKNRKEHLGKGYEKKYRIFISILALIFSIGATCIGFGLIGSSSLKFGMKYVCDFVFLMQTVATCRVVIELLKNKLIRGI